MSDLRISEHTKLTGGGDFQALADQASMHVWLWDTGPKKPMAPAKPVAPKGKEGDPEYELAVIEFKEDLEEYGKALKTHRQAKIDFEKWHKDQGGAIEIRMFSCDAQDALARDPERYFISARTRGHERLKNHGLPPGHKPGHGQAENMRRAEEGQAEYAAARARDPVFGNPELRP